MPLQFLTFWKSWNVRVLIADWVLPEPVRPVISHPRTKSSIVQESPPSPRIIFPEWSAEKNAQAPKSAQKPTTQYESGGVRRKHTRPANQRRTTGQEGIKTFSSRDWGSRTESRNWNSRRFGRECFGCSFEVDGRDAGTVFKSFMGKPVHVGRPEGEVLAEEELRSFGPSADG